MVGEQKRTAAKASKVAPGSAGALEAEVKSAEHDDLLMWLIQNLEAVARKLFDRPAGWLEDVKEESKREYEDGCDRVVGKLESLAKAGAVLEPAPFSDRRESGGVVVDEVLASKMSRAATALRQAKQIFPSAGELESTAGHAILGLYEVMQRLPNTDDLPAKLRARTGEFVDLSFVVNSVKSISYKSWVTRDWHSHYDRDLELVERACDEGRADRRVESWTTEHESSRCWVDVRVESFTLGDVLQDLKTLKSLEDGRQVILCVKTIDAGMRKLIEREGFPVVVRGEV